MRFFSAHARAGGEIDRGLHERENACTSGTRQVCNPRTLLIISKGGGINRRGEPKKLDKNIHNTISWLGHGLSYCWAVGLSLYRLKITVHMACDQDEF